MQVDENWPQITKLFKQSFNSSFHYAIASVNDNGDPHVTPIGSLILNKPGQGLYFEEFTRQLPQNISTHSKVCILAVNSSRWFWIKSLFLGKFSSPPAVRLHGVVGSVREATQNEITLWHRRLKAVRLSKGYAMMWANMKMVRDIQITGVDPVHIGEMTRYAWNKN